MRDYFLSKCDIISNILSTVENIIWGKYVKLMYQKQLNHSI